MSIATLITGGNVGDSIAVLAEARERIAREVGRIVAASSVRRSAAWGFESDDFHNQVLVVETQLAPMELLDVTQSIERAMGRTAKSVEGRYEPRIIDIDILYYDDAVIRNERLTLPHPHIAQREFVTSLLDEIERTEKTKRT